MPKPFMTYEEQIEKLREKQLQIPDEDSAKEALQRLSYFSLITGYKNLFKNKSTGQYRDGASFSDILFLYRFDESLRELTLHHLLHIEHHIRSLLSYSFCEIFGESQQAYLTPSNYNNIPKNQRDIRRLIDRHISPLLEHPTDYPYIEHHKAAYHTVPLWALSKALTFGTVSKIYLLSKSQIQSSISQKFQSVNEKQLGQFLKVLTIFRNVCAHGERLFSYRCTKQIPDMPLHKKLHIPQKGSQYLYGKQDYFSIVISFRYLLPHDEFLLYKRQLARLMEKMISHSAVVTLPELLEAMGMPENWKHITKYEI